MTKRMACLLGLALCLLSARAAAFDVRTATAATYAGEYQFSSGYLVSIWRNADELLFQGVGQPRIVLSPTSAIQVLPTGDGVPFSQESEFKVKGGKVRIRFASDEDGNITSLQYEGGWDRCTAGFKALKLSESSGRAVLEAIGARVANGTPRPGSEEALLHLVAGVLHGTPDYDRLGQDLATAMQCQLSHVRSHLRDLGNPINTRFVEVDKLGWDIYEIAHFRGAKTRWHVNLANDGRIVGAVFVDITNGDSSPCRSGSGCMRDFRALNPK